MPVRKIISDNLFMLGLIRKTAPGYTALVVFIAVFGALADFISNAFLLRYAVNGIGEGKSFDEIATVLLVCMALQLLYLFLYQIYWDMIKNKEMLRFTAIYSFSFTKKPPR